MDATSEVEWLSGIFRDMRMWCQVAWTVAPPYVAAERRLTQSGRHVGWRYQIYFTKITKEPVESMFHATLMKNYTSVRKFVPPL